MTDTIEQVEKNDLNRAFQILEFYGVPKTRARYVSQGIEVLATRLGKEVDSLQAAQAESKAEVERLQGLSEELPKLISYAPDKSTVCCKWGEDEFIDYDREDATRD